MSTQSYLTFNLGKEVFGSPVSKVTNILEMCQITKVPLAPNHMVGVINLRGTVLPVIDTRVKFGMEPTVYTDNTCILVLEILVERDIIMVGALVDSVQEVIELSDEQIDAAPSLGSRLKTENIVGVAQANNEFIMLLEMDRVFSIEDFGVLSSEIA